MTEFPFTVELFLYTSHRCEGKYTAWCVCVCEREREREREGMGDINGWSVREVTCPLPFSLTLSHTHTHTVSPSASTINNRKMTFKVQR